jgi:uncharacterized protein Usg
MKWMTQLWIFLIAALTQHGAFASSPVTTLSENRVLDFNDYALTNNAPTPTWVHEGPPMTGLNSSKALLSGTNHFHRTGWFFRSCRTGCSGYMSGARIVPPLNPITVPILPAISSNLAANLRNDLDAYIESPVFTNGVGTLYFEAINGIAGNPVEITVDVSTNSVAGTNGLEYVWQELDKITLDVPTMNDFYRYSRLLNYRQWMKIRIRRTGTSYSGSVDANFTVIDNIRVSCPPSDVSVYNVSAVHQSGSLSLNCFVSNVDTNSAATNRVVTGYYRWLDLSATWTNVPLTLADAGDGQGNGERYSAILPVQLSSSRLEYYLVCSFDGYWYSSPDYAGQGYTNYASESRSPVTTPSQTNAYGGANNYVLTVNSGSGSGASYTNGQQVAIVANALTGMAFYQWTGATQYVANVSSLSTIVTMPAADIALTATYTNVYYALTVNSGSGDGAYTNGAQVTIAADMPAAGMAFYRWTGDTPYVASVTSATTTVTMPASAVVLTATYISVYTLSVANGSGSGASYTNGQLVAISADAPAPGKAFERWTGDVQYVSSVTSAVTTVTMPAASITLTATYVDVYTLTVNSGSGGGSYTNGQRVAISADAPAAGKAFERWTGDVQYVASVTSAATTVTMPAANITLMATYVDVYTLTVNSGSGGGSYTNGQRVAISANAPAAGRIFDCWTGNVQYVSSVTSATATVTMPASSIALTATYSNLYYNLAVVNGSGSGAYTNGQKVTISADLSGGKVFGQWAGSVAYVSSVTSATTTVTMPASDITVMALLSLLTTTLPESRYLDFNDYALTNNGTPPTWVHEGPPMTGLNSSKALLSGTNHFHRTGWFFRSCRTGCSGYMGGARIVPPLSPITVPILPAISSNLAANLRNDLDAYIESPVFTNGVGTLYFEAINGIAGNPQEITVDVSTNSVVGTNGFEYVWQELDKITLDVPTMNDFYRYSRLLNYRQWMKIRIRRTGTTYSGSVDANFAVIDNIRVSIPPSDVSITKTDCPFEPGYPGVGTNITVRCYVSDVDTNVPTVSRLVRVVYRWRYLNQMIGPWYTNDMTYVSGTGSGDGNTGSGNRYATTLSPFTEIGDLEYYFICTFGGYVFQSPDLTGTGLAGTSAGSPGGYPYRTEDLSPCLFRSTGTREFYFRLRPYQSKYGALYAVTDQLSDPVAMALTGNNEWRAMVPVGATGITNLTWRFMGVGKYDAGAETASTGAVYWAGLSDVSGGNVPYGGTCVPDETRRLNVGISSGAYAMLTLNTDSLQYMANRAEYQNFNYWPALLDKYSESNGQVEKQHFLQTFDTWPTNTEVMGDTAFEEPFVLGMSGRGAYSASERYTDAFWLFGSGKAAWERTFDTHPAAAVNARNVALRLKGGDGDLGLGYVHNTAINVPDGLRQISFKARLGQTSDNYDVVFHRDDFTKANYLVRATAKAVDLITLSPENPWISLIAYYRDPGNFYEFRATQITNTTFVVADQEKRVRLQLFKWANGVQSQLGSAVDLSLSSSPLLSVSDSVQTEMRLYTATTTQIICKFAGADRINYTDYSPLTMGTYGFLSSECKGQLSNVSVGNTTKSGSNIVLSGSMLTTLATSGLTLSDINTAWYYPTNRYEAKASVSPYGIYSIVPSQPLGIYVLNTNSTDWVLASQVSVTNFSYQTNSVTFNSWQSEYVKLQVLGGDADVVVDELNVFPWHGKTVSEDTPANYKTYHKWMGTEAWVVSNNTSAATIVQLDHSRADPSLDQTVRSLLLTNGMGVLEFDYRVIRPPAKITVQYVNQGWENSPSAWQNVTNASFVVSNVTDWVHASAYLGLSEPGYFRVLNERSAGYTNAWIDINNVTAWDEPFVTNTSWKVYNAKITQTDTNRVYLDETKACFLNNSTTNEASPPQNWFQPFLQSSTLPKGLGTLSFLARAYTNNQSATVYVYASTTGWGAPTNEWFELTRFENITNMLYKLYTYAPAGGRKDINAIRLMTSNAANAKRVCLEEVSIAEPVLPGFDIVNVKLLLWDNGTYTEHGQPLAGEDIDVEARVANQQLVPSNIAMYVSYYVGTNVWGVGRWPGAQTVTKRMHAVTNNSTLYRTRHDAGDPVVIGLDTNMVGPIKNQDANAIVQYYVWAEYDGGAPTKLNEQQATFDNPAWYYPVDLNTKFAAQGGGWSPYYFVYNVRRNAVWINEVNSVDYIASGSDRAYNNPYIEIAVPAWLDLAGWSVDLVRYAYVTVATITIPSGLPTHTADTNGYYFFVIGDVSPVSGSPALPRKDLGYQNFANKIPYGYAGGLRLKRPQGMYEQTIAYDYNNFSGYGALYSGPDFAANDPQGKFVYVGRDNYGGSLSKIGSTTPDTPDTTNTWFFPKTWTPGAPNEGQTIWTNGDSLQPGVSNIYITSLFTLLKGTQNDKRMQVYEIKTRVGMSTNIVYAIDDWYRLYSLLVNNSQVLSADEMTAGKSLYNLQLLNLQTNVSITAQVQLRKDLAEYESNPSILAWILGFADGDLVPSYKRVSNDWVEMPMTEKYWLDLNPTITNYFRFPQSIATFDSVNTNLYQTIRMSVSNQFDSAQGLTNLQGGVVLKLRAKQSIFDPKWTLVRQYSLNSSSFVSNNICHVCVPDPFAVLIAGMIPASCYFDWLIEMDDPRVEVEWLINSLLDVPWPEVP